MGEEQVEILNATVNFHLSKRLTVTLLGDGYCGSHWMAAVAAWTQQRRKQPRDQCVALTEMDMCGGYELVKPEVVRTAAEFCQVARGQALKQCNSGSRHQISVGVQRSTVTLRNKHVPPAP